MKLRLLASALVLSLAAIAPANAATINIAAVANAQLNSQEEAATQAAATLNASLGPVTFSTIDLSATSVINVATMTADIDQTATGLGNLSLVASDQFNSSTNAVDQTALTANLTGAVGSSVIKGASLNGLNIAAANVTVVQK